jgi:prepilin peptidase CpaA
MEQMMGSVVTSMLLELSVVLLLMIILIPAALVDYKERRIPNALSMSGWLLGPALNFAISGVPGLKASLLGFIILFALTFPFWLLGWMGAGDVKLMGTVGALIGNEHIWFVLLCIVIAGLIHAMLILIRRGLLNSSFQRYCAMIGISMVSQRPTFIESDTGEQKETMPYAVPIAFGTLIALLLLYK